MRASIYIGLFFFLASSAHALSGKLQSLTEYFPKDLGEPTYMVAPRLGIELDQDHKFTKKFRYSFKGTFQSNPVSKYQPENYFGDLKEAFVEYKPNRTTKFLLGWNTVNWGVMDIFSPMDVVNQHTYFDPLNADKRGAGMVNLQWNPRGWGFSALYIPAQAKPIFPSNDSRWLPRDSIEKFVVNNQTARMPEHPVYDIQDPITLSRALNDNFGFKMERHWDAFDLHAMYFNGASSTPSIVPNIADAPIVILDPLTVQLNNPVILKPLFYRTQSTGVGFSANLGDVILRGESVYQDAVSENDNGYFYSKWSWQHGLGLEKNWEVGSSTLTTLVHYYYGVFPHDDSTFESNIPSSGFRLFDNAPMLGFRYAISDEKFFYGSVLYNVNQEGFFWIAGYQQKLTDALRWDISWRDISANKEGLLKTYDHNDHAVMDLTYFF